MKTVYKYKLDTARTTIALPPTAKVVHVGRQRGQVHLWVEQSSNSQAKVPREFGIYPTGGTIDDSDVHIGSVIDDGNGLVWHVYEKP